MIFKVVPTYPTATFFIADFSFSFAEEPKQLKEKKKLKLYFDMFFINKFYI